MIEDFAATYRQMSDDELERLLADSHDLLEDAQISLLAEFKSRGRSDKEAELLAEAGRKLTLPLTETEGADLQLTAEVGSLFRFNGTGRVFLGEGNHTYNETYDYEEFDTTLFWTLFYVPVVPRGRFRVRRRVRYSNFVIVRRLD